MVIRVRGRRAARRGKATRAVVRRVVPVFAVTDNAGVAHLVTEEAVAAGRSFGRYRAGCGWEVVAASLTTPECGSCRSCWRWVAGR